MAAKYNYADDPLELQKIDISHLLVKAWKQFGRTWWILLILLTIGAGAVFGYQRCFHTDIYEAYASFSVSVNSGNSGMSSYYNQLSLKRLGESFPYILESGALRTIVREKLDLPDLPVTINAEVVSDTNLFRISVRGEDPELTAKVLDTVIEKYPEVARYVIGKTELTMLDYSGVPADPVNTLSPLHSAIRGASLGGAAYLLILLLLVLTRQTVESGEDLKRYTSFRCLATIPKVYLKQRSKRRSPRLLVDQKKVPQAFIEAIHLLRIRTLRELDRMNGKVLLVTSAGEMEGKTTVTANLALSCAEKGFRILLIDGDLRHPSAAEIFGIGTSGNNSGASGDESFPYGLSDVLSDNVPVEKAISKYKGTTLDILPGRGSVAPDQISRLIGRESTSRLLQYARGSYDYVIVDSPPSGILQDALILAEYCDGALAVIRQNYLTRSRILEFLNALTDTGIRILGSVINGEEDDVGSYGYGRYGYGNAYGKYGAYSKYGYGDKSKAGQD